MTLRIQYIHIQIDTNMDIYAPGSTAQSFSYSNSQTFLLPLSFICVLLSTGIQQSTRESSPKKAAPLPPLPWLYCPHQAGIPALRKWFTEGQMKPPRMCQVLRWKKVRADGSCHPSGTWEWEERLSCFGKGSGKQRPSSWQLRWANIAMSRTAAAGEN